MTRHALTIPVPGGEPPREFRIFPFFPFGRVETTKGTFLFDEEAARPVARAIAQALPESRRLLLLGMGGSHFAGRCAEVEYRRLGLDATALVLSEALYHPLPALPRVTLLSSQSGESGEIVRYLETPPARNAASALP